MVCGDGVEYLKNLPSPFNAQSPLTIYLDPARRDENGKKLYANIADYCVERRNDSTWFVEGVQRYHRMFSTIVNTLCDAGFRILKMAEPYPTEELVRKYPEYYDLYHKPDFLFVKAAK